MGVFLNCAERAQRLLDPTALLQVGEALVLFDLGNSLFFFGAEFNIIQGVVGETNQVGSDSQGELSEGNFAIRLVTESAQDRIDVLLQNFLLELENEILDVFEVQEPKLAIVDQSEHRNRIKFLHRLQCLLLYFDLHVVVDLFFKKSRQFKLDVTL